jgi:hypothetical protein
MVAGLRTEVRNLFNKTELYAVCDKLIILFCNRRLLVCTAKPFLSLINPGHLSNLSRALL